MPVYNWGGLIHDENSTVIQLAHLSVKDYLTSDRIKLSRLSSFSLDTILANTAIAQACLVYLLRPEFASQDCDWGVLHRRLAALSLCSQFLAFPCPSIWTRARREDFATAPELLFTQI